MATVRETLESNITPIVLGFSEVRFFEREKRKHDKLYLFQLILKLVRTFYLSSYYFLLVVFTGISLPLLIVTFFSLLRNQSQPGSLFQTVLHESSESVFVNLLL